MPFSFRARMTFGYLTSQTGETRRLTHDSQKEEEPTFSPAGDAVAFVRQNNIYTISLNTG